MTGEETVDERTRITYVADAYCGWCYGFDDALTGFVDKHRAQIHLEVLSGGLFTGARVAPISSMPYVAAANERIAMLTGARFGDAYLRLVAEGTFAMDSSAAATGFAALRSTAPERALEILVAVQRAFYQEGLSLSDPGTFRRVGEDLGLDTRAVRSALTSPQAAADARADLRRARSLGVDSYPTVLVHLPDGATGRLGGPASTAQQLGDAFAALLGPHRSPAHSSATR